MGKGHQIIYKESKGYHDLHVAELLARGYVIILQTPVYTLLGPGPTTKESTSKTDSAGG